MFVGPITLHRYVWELNRGLPALQANHGPDEVFLQTYCLLLGPCGFISGVSNVRLCTISRTRFLLQREKDEVVTHDIPVEDLVAVEPWKKHRYDCLEIT